MVEGNTTRIRIEADGSMAIDGIGKVDLAMDRMGQRTNSVFGQLKQNWVAYTAGIYAAAASLQKAWDFAEEEADYAESLETLNTLSSQYNVTSQQLVGAISRNSEGLIGVASAAKIASDALAKGFTPAQLEQMAKWAPMIDDFSSSVGSSEEAFEALVASVGAGRERGLVQLLGTTIDLKTAFGDQAASMSKAEKAMAIYNLAAKRMEELQRAGVGATDSLADKMKRLKKQVEELKLSIGDIIIRVGAGIMGLFQTVADSATKIARLIMVPATAVAMMTDFLGITKGKAAEYKQAMEAMLASAEDLGKKSAANFDLMKKGMQAGSALAKGAAVNLGMGAGTDAGKEAEAFAKGREKMLAALSKFQADTGAIRAAGIVEDQKAFESRLGLFRAEIAEKKQEFIDDQTRLDLILALKRQQWEEERKAYERRVELEREITDLTRQQRVLIAEQQVASLQNAFSVLGAGDQGQRAGMIMSIQNQTDPYTKDYEAWEKIQDQKIERMYELGATEASLKDEYRAYELQQERMVQQQKYAMAASTMGMVAGIAQNLFVATGSRNKALFEMMKVASTAEAIINTATGATKALAQGGFFGIALAAAVIAAGMAQVATIQSQRFNGPSSGVSVGGIGGGMPITQTAPPPAPEKEKTGPSIINFYVNGDIVDHDQFARTLLPYLNKAEAAGVA